MIATATKNHAEPKHSSADAVTRLRLVKLQHSDDPVAAAIATAASLLLGRIDRLVEVMESAA